jgi:hypothetical protein
MDDSYMDYKNLGNLYVGKSSLPLGVHNTYNYPQSNYAVLNSFRSDYEDFSHFQDTSLNLSSQNLSLKSLDLSNLKDSKNQSTSFNTQTLLNNNLTLAGPESQSLEVNPTQLN